MASTYPAVSHLKKELMKFKKNPDPNIEAALPSNILEWHYVIRGPDDSPYKGGMCHGMLVFPPSVCLFV